jgi:hypothetical protein
VYYGERRRDWEHKQSVTKEEESEVKEREGGK